MTAVSFQWAEFQPLTWKQFLREYRTSIGPQVVWGKIRFPRVGMTLALDGVPALHLPWYHGGDWRDGVPRVVARGKACAIIRIPAVKVREKLLVLDGCHRLTELKPRMVVVDWFEPVKQERRYLTDLFNSYWQEQ